ncbi:DUF402 domain-containing protein [Paenibacillus sp. CR_12]|uniref:DUF402 domain-containing protein n=1 Tax=Paenibacillus sp. CR_12 TaxID=3055793 RepID=UPI0035BFE5C9
MQHFPSESNYCVTTMLNEKKEIIQWYFDISKNIEISDQGVPFGDDLYLDVIVFPNGNLYIKDEDELEEALNSNDIELEDYNLAKSNMKDLIKEIESMENKIIKNGLEHFKFILEASQGRH